MKPKYLVLTALSAVAILTGCNNSEIAQQPASPAPTSPAVSSPGSSPTGNSNLPALKTANFTKGDHAVSGGVKIVTESNGDRYLEIDDSFKTDSGPALYVLLHKQDNPQSYDEQQYVSLGRLQQTSGSQRYAIPANVNLDDFKSAVIWCKQFNVTFGHATFL